MLYHILIYNRIQDKRAALYTKKVYRTHILVVIYRRSLWLLFHNSGLLAYCMDSGILIVPCYPLATMSKKAWNTFTL